jgi:uncharacterized protein with PQ loop repeat
VLFFDRANQPQRMEVVSQLLGYAIIVGSFALKIPQIMKILGSKSVVGLSFPMFALEMFG